MKKILIRIVGSLCIIASLAIIFFAPICTIEDVSRKDIRNFRQAMTKDLETVQDAVLREIKMFDKYKEELKDLDLPHTRSRIKQRFSQAEVVVSNLCDHNVSLQEAFIISTKAPRLISDTEKLFESTFCTTRIFKASNRVDADDAQDFVDAIAEYTWVFTVIICSVLFFVVLGIASAVTHSLNKVRFPKYIYLGLLLVLVVGLCVCMPMVNYLIQDALVLPNEIEDMVLQVSIFPFISLALAFVPMVLDIIFERKKAKALEV